MDIIVADPNEVSLTEENRAEAHRACDRFRKILRNSPLDIALGEFISKESKNFGCGKYFVLDPDTSYAHRQPADFVGKVHAFLDEHGIDACS